MKHWFAEACWDLSWLYASSRPGEDTYIRLRRESCLFGNGFHKGDFGFRLDGHLGLVQLIRNNDMLSCSGCFIQIRGLQTRCDLVLYYFL